jgi:hypothetical protein
MFNTVSDLWSSLNIQDGIPINSPLYNSPLLNLPLSLFEKKDHLKLLIILYLYSINLIDDFKIVEHEKEIGRLSFTHIQELFNSVSRDMMPALINATRSIPNSQPLKIQPKISSWINKNQIMQYMQQIYKTIYLTLAKYIHTSDVRLDLPQDKYQATLKTLFIKLGIKIPTRLHLNYEIVLHKNLSDYPEIEKEQWPELIFYCALFLFEHAEFDKHFLKYNYTGEELPPILDQMAKKNISYLNSQLSKPTAKIADNSFELQIRRDIQTHFHQIPAKILALICFKNFPLLRILFPRPISNIPLLKINEYIAPLSSNPFMQKIIYTEHNTNPTMSSFDENLLNQLQKIAHHRNKAKEEAHKENSMRLLSSSTPFSLFRPLLKQKLATEFEEYYIIDNESKLPFDKYCLSFNIIKAQIHDPELHSIISIEHIENIGVIRIIDYKILAEFIIKFAHPLSQKIPNVKDLNHLFEIMGNHEQIMSVIKTLENNPQFIHTLFNNLEKKESKFEAIIKELQLLTQFYESFLRDNDSHNNLEEFSLTRSYALTAL